jgi:hypothetical protein
MESLDIKQIWKSAQKDEELKRRYSLEDIQKFRRHKSHQTSKSISWSILFDIIYKSIIVAEIIYLYLSLNYQYPFQIIIGLLLLIAVVLILFEINFLKKHRSIRDTDSVIDNLKNKLYYLRTTYRKFIFTSALSNPLFVLCGFFIYFHFKYNEIKLGTPVQDPVLYLILLIAFALSFISQLSVNKMQIKELRESIFDMDDVELAAIKIEESGKRRRNTIILFSLLILLGVIILFLLLLVK